MYSRAIVARSEEALRLGAKAEGLNLYLIRHSIAEVKAAVEALNELLIPGTGDLGDDYELSRPLTDEEQFFIDNELLLCSIDFEYWAERYCYIERDHVEGGVELMRLWGSQRILLNRIAEIEERMWASYDKQLADGLPLEHVRVDGICLVLHKARQLGACLPAGTRVLTSDLRWVPIEKIRPGDQLVSVDEEAAGRGSSRKMRDALVEATTTYISDTIRLTLADGRTISASDNHRFLCKVRGSTSAVWRRVDEMRVGDEIRHLVTPPPAGTSPVFEDGWFSGLLDGEGSLRPKHHGGSELTVSQVEGAVLDRAEQYLRSHGHSFRREIDTRKGGETSKLGNKPVHKFVINRLGEIFEVLQRTRPSRFVGSSLWWEGKELPNGDSAASTWATVTRIETGTRERVYDLQTSTKTFIAEGLVTHNTTVSQALLMHRAVFSQNLFCLTASADDEKTQRVNDKAVRIFNHLPFWMKPHLGSKVKDRGMKFTNLDTEVALQDGNQEKGVGQGSTVTICHVTEMSVWNKPENNFENHLFRAIPYTLRTLVILESTANGVGNWFHTFVRNLIQFPGTDRWQYIFVPWYAEKGKYRLPPPEGWVPNPITKAHARKVWETSERYVGKQVMLDDDQLYYWEREYLKAQRDGKLNWFLTNYPAEPEESFQSSTVSPFHVDVISRSNMMCKEPLRIWEWDTSGRRKYNPAFGSYADDPRGLLCFWEEPSRNHDYIIGVDATRGIPNWTRTMKTANDKRIDNGVLSVWRIGENGRPDVQVAEYAAPVESEFMAQIGDFLGRLYRGRDDEFCLQIIETYPSPGTAYQAELQNKYGYYNLWRRQNQASATWAREFGWEANGKSVQDLWVRTKRRLAFFDPKRHQDSEVGGRTKVLIRSRHLVSEMQTCEEDPKLMTAKAEHGYHDDRLRAAQLALYGAHSDQYEDDKDPEPIAEMKEDQKARDFQSSDCTVAEMYSIINDRMN